MAAKVSTNGTDILWESPRLTRPDGEFVVRAVARRWPLATPDSDVAATAGLAGVAAVALSSLLRVVSRALGWKSFSVCLVERVREDSRSSAERTVRVVHVRREREALEQARQLADDYT